MKKDELLKRANEAHKRVTKVLDGLTQEQITRVGLNPEWSVKDLLAHLTSWKERGIAELVRIDQGTWQPQKMEMEQVHEFNEKIVSERRADSLSEVRADFERAHNEMTRLMEDLPDELDEISPAFRVVNGTAVRHINHHAAQLEEWKRKLERGE